MYNKYLSGKQESKADDSQPSVGDFYAHSPTTSYSSSHSKQKQLTSSLVHNLIVKCSLPVSMVENPFFKEFIADLDPNFTMPCRRTVTQTLIPQLLEAKQKVLQELLHSASDVALTVGIWTDRRVHSFLGVTVHTYDPQTAEATSKLLKFTAIRSSHTGQNIADALESIIEEFKLQGKVHYIVTDNASNMKKALTFVFPSDSEKSDGSEVGVEDSNDSLDDDSLWSDVADDQVLVAVDRLGERVPCFAHSLQLTVRDGLAKMGVARQAIAKCCKLASLVHQSSHFCTAFQDAFGQRSIPVVNDTRWNSTFTHLKSIVCLDSTKLSEVVRNTNQMNLVFSNRETQILQELVQVLEPFAKLLIWVRVKNRLQSAV